MHSLSSPFKRTNHVYPKLHCSFWSAKSFNKEDYSYYSQIRIYKDRRFPQLLNQLMIANFCKSEFFVKNSLTFVNLLQKMLGMTISQFLIRNTMGQVFTGGESLASMNEVAVKLNNTIKLPVVYFYSHEVMPGYEFSFEEMEENKREFIRSVEAAKNKNERNMAALKVSAIGSFESIKVLNVSENNLLAFFGKIDNEKKGKITVKQLRDYVSENLKNIKEEDFSSFVTKILGKEMKDTVEISLLEWKINVHAVYINENEKTRNPVIKHFCTLSDKDYKNLNEMNTRLVEIFDHASKIQARILVDAEQTFAQKAVDVIAELFQFKYNKNQALIYNTMQNYLKSMKDRINYEIEKCKFLNLPIAVKMVRGAYMDEERLLAKQKKYETPICETFQLTTDSYHSNFANLIKNLTPKSEILIGSHNKDTVEFVKKMLETYKIDKMHGGIKFAQLFGLADHLTYSLNHEGYHVLKLVPYGQTKILIPYLLRRAQESKVNLTSTDLQKALLKHEISQRFLLR